MRSALFCILSSTLLLSCLGCGLRTVKGPASGKSYFVGFLGVEYWDEVRETYAKNKLADKAEIASAVRGRKVILGMTAEHVKVALSPLEYPTLEINRSVYPHGVHEQWVINHRRSTVDYHWQYRYIYLKDGVVTSYSQ